MLKKGKIYTVNALLSPVGGGSIHFQDIEEGAYCNEKEAC